MGHAVASTLASLGNVFDRGYLQRLWRASALSHGVAGASTEKYNVVTDSSNIVVAEGYRGNIIGFGWTNAVFLELLKQLPPELLNRLDREKLVR